uniref:Uncharacterized protein n=1 Tax=Romanomermis culicivorax TaxID=13658 RepID=A0A915INS5_ROMCU
MKKSKEDQAIKITTSGSKITILLSICVFLTMVSNATPPTSEAVPLLGVLFSFHMIVVSASLRKILLDWLPRLLNVKRPERKTTALLDALDEKCMNDFDSRIEQCLTKLIIHDSMNNNQEVGGLDDGYKAVLTTMQLVHNDVRFITGNMKKHDEAEDVKNDWKSRIPSAIWLPFLGDPVRYGP